MKDKNRTKAQLITELVSLRQQVADLEISEARYKQAEEVRQENPLQIEQIKQEWEATVDSLSELVCVLDNQANIIRTNRVVEQWGLRPVFEVKGIDIHHLLHPQCVDSTCYLDTRWFQAWTAIKQNQPTEWEVEDKILKRRLHFQIRPIATPKNKLRRGTDSVAVVVVQDITKRKQLEEMWRRYEFIVNTSKDFMTLVSINFTYEAVNEAYCEAHQKTRDEIIGKKVAYIWGTEIYWTQIKPYLVLCLGGTEAHYQGWFQFATLGRRYFDVAYYPYRNSDGIVTHAVVISRDITERKQTEESLLESQEEIGRRNRELTLFNRVIAASAVGLEPKEILKTACYELARAFDLPQATAALLDNSQTTATVIAEYRVRGRPSAMNNSIPVENNAYQYLLKSKMPLVIEDAQNDPRLAAVHDLMHKRDTISLLILPLIIKDEVIGYLGLEAITPRIFSTEEVNLAWSVADQVSGALARARLGKSHRLLSAVVEQNVDSVIITDTKGVITYVNPTFERLTGYRRAEVIGQNPRILKGGQQKTAFYQKLWSTITAGHVWSNHLINKKKNGSLYTVDALIAPVRNETGTIVSYVAIERDMTHQLQLEEQLRQVQKMDAVGRLAGGIAHDFNNILTIISGHSEFLLSRYYDLNDPRREDVEHIKQASERATVLTRQLLTFSRQQSVQLRIINLNQVVATVQEMLSRLIGEDITLIVTLAPDLGHIKADSGQLEQVLVNLAVNARDAMPHGGTLTLKTSSINLTYAEARKQPGLTAGVYSQLIITDTGVGMNKETKTHIFEPFFTTKKAGQNAGLGLSTVYGIIQQNGGHIKVNSKPGQGTTFNIYLPQVDQAPEVVDQPQFDTELEGQEAILLVEDEVAVRFIIRKFLQKQGYTVLEAKNVQDAIQMYKQHKEAINLLISDVIMPEMNGPELVTQLVELDSNLKALYISGYTHDVLDRSGVLTMDATIVQKPFSAEELVSKVRQILNDD